MSQNPSGKQSGVHFSQGTTHFQALVPDPVTRHMPYPLTDLQQAYWIGQTDLIELGNMFAHIYTEADFTQLDLTRLVFVVQRLLERHDVLRSIVLPDGQQQVLPATPPYHIHVTDLRGQDEQRVTSQLAAIREEMSQQGPGTHAWPLWEIRASLLDHQRTRLHVSISLLLVDGRSATILTAEAVELYQNPDALLPPIELTYRDCIMALNEFEQAGLYQRSFAYWKQRVATLPPAPELPLVKRPGDVKKARFVSHSTQLDAHTWQRLKTFAMHQGLRSPIAVLYTAFVEVLATWSKTPHFTIAMLFANRLSGHLRARDIVGNFSTTILLEVNNTTPGSFITRAKRLERQLWHDLAHSDVSGVRVIREMAKAQGWTSQAIMPVAFVSTVGLTTKQGQGVFMGSEEQGKVVYHSIQTPQVQLDHQVYEEKDGLRLEWDMVDELFPEGLPTEMFAAYRQLLEDLANDESMWHRTYTQLVPTQQIAQFKTMNATEAPISDDLLHILVKKQVMLRPTQKAVITTKRTLTYAEIDDMANKVGYWLRLAGAQPNTLVAVVMEKGWEQVIATLAVLYAGAAYLPIDAALPQERLWYLLAHGSVQLVLTQPWVNERLTWPDTVQRLCIDNTQLNALPLQPLNTIQKKDDLAYVIYTSGSTGLPKGVMIDHRGAINTLIDINKRFAVGPTDRVLALSSLSFDLSVYDIFGILGAGGAIVIPDAEVAQEPAHWTRLLIQEQVTIWNSVPALMEMLTEYIADQRDLVPRSLRLAMLSGDWIALKLPAKIQALSADIQVVSLGGATEASIWSIFYPIETIKADWKSIPYGRPLLNQHVYVLDANLNHRPHWVPGHFYIGGMGLARGYWRDEVKTNASFITHPQTGERLYRTGDLGRYLPDGTIEFLGREDFQVKVQGYRIELGEVEAILAQHPAVHEAVAAVEANKRGEKRLLAFVIPQQRQQLDPLALRSYARTRLPAYMVPAVIKILDSLPLSANGKVNRQALLTCHEAGELQRVTFVTPRDEIERQLVKLWEVILDRYPIGVTDNFFELGGNSLAAMRLMVRIRQQFSQELPFSLLFAGATVAELANVLRRPSLPSQRSHSPVVAIQPQGAKQAFFCIHPVGGNVFCYAALSRHLGTDQPFYALQAPGLDEDTEPYVNVVEMATHYKEAIQEVQPAGPYLLGGWSMGGIVAFEIAQQLRKEREEVALLALLDSAVPSSPVHTHPSDDVDFLMWFAKDLGGGTGKRMALTREDLQNLQLDEQIASVLEQAGEASILAPEMDISYLHRLIHVFKAHALALLSYTPYPYPYPAVLLATEETLAEHACDHSLGWGEFIGSSLDVHFIPGNHYTMMTESYVQQLAKSLSMCLEKSPGSSLR